MKKENNKITYFLYARKSSESEDRQIQSIDDQINRLEILAKEMNLDVKKKFTEAKSAKKPNNRPLFDEMLERIENGEVNGILCWQLNRLTRNPIDSGKLSWMLQQGKLKSIRTTDREYLPEDNVILFNVDAGSANQYILDLRKNVKRGIDSKLQKGWLPNLAPAGYLNSKIKDRGENDILIDNDRFALVRKMWDLMLTGNYTPPKILDIANNEWGYRTRKTKRAGGNPLSRGGIYRIFTNMFYSGIIDHKGVQYEGKHEPMITLEEYDRVQKILGRKGRPRPQTHKFPFTGMLRCAECGCLYTAETKTKFVKKTGKLTEYTYYHCTRRKKDYKCTQTKSLTDIELETQIEDEINKYTIIPDFLNWALEDLNEKNDTEIEDRSKVYEMQHKALTQAQAELDELTKMRYRLLIDDETFLKEKPELINKIAQLKSKLKETEARAERWLDLSERTFNFACYANTAFNAGKLELKKEILMTLGQFPIIKDKKVTFYPSKWFVPIINGYPKLKADYERLELPKTGQNRNKKEALASIRSQWRRRWDSNPRTPYEVTVFKTVLIATIGLLR